MKRSLSPTALRAAIREAVRVAPADRRVTVDVAADGSVRVQIEPLTASGDDLALTDMTRRK